MPFKAWNPHPNNCCVQANRNIKMMVVNIKAEQKY
jgi:hypothetical protein